jgi:hypothetical protein
MAALIQCKNCGAVLASEDVFCGECGAPNPATEESLEPAAVEQPVAPPPASPLPAPPPAEPIPAAPVQPKPSAMGWRVAFIALVVLGVIACLSGLLVFVLFGSMEGENTTPAEDWLFSALCCLLPIGGSGVILVASGAAIWFARLRDR